MKILGIQIGGRKEGEQVLVSRDQLLTLIKEADHSEDIDRIVELASQTGQLDEKLILRLRAEKNSLERRRSLSFNDRYGMPLSQRPDDLASMSTETSEYVGRIQMASSENECNQISHDLFKNRIPHEDSLRQMLSLREQEIKKESR